MNKQVAKLVLKSSDLVTNSVGTANTDLTNMTWNNINLRTLLGDMWDKYELFNLSLVEMASSLSYFETSDDQCCVLINLNGLSFSNCNYDTAQKLNTNNCVIGTFQFPSQSDVAGKLYQGQNIITFDKHSEMCNINIFYTDVFDGKLPTAAYPEVCLIFNITGVSIDPDTESSRRFK